MTPELEQRIRNLANRFWEEEGRPEGKEKEHWRRARESLEGQGADGPSEATQYTDQRDARGGGGRGQTAGDPDGAQSGQTKEQVFLKSTTRLTPD